MPLYDFECQSPDCGMTTERITHPGKRSITCPNCGARAKKIISIGGIECDSANDVKWLESACMTLLPDGHRPLETRGEYKRYLKDNGIIPAA